jgi:hypothetical protein
MPCRLPNSLRIPVSRVKSSVDLKKGELRQLKLLRHIFTFMRQFQLCRKSFSSTYNLCVNKEEQ